MHRLSLHIVLSSSIWLCGIALTAYPAYTKLKHGGRLMGERLVFDDLVCETFLGISYAKPPVDDLRFQKPQSPDAWTNTRRATNYGASCQQPTGPNHVLNNQTGVSEDCLYLNVFTQARKVDESVQLPVFVWVHGGGFYYGSGSHVSPENICRNLVSRGVVVVTINYRLGPFGFMAKVNSTVDSLFVPNLGLWDIQFALKWVQEHVASFHGDATQVTIGGHGAGAAAVSILSSSSAASGLFRRAILMSGSSMAPWALTNHSYRSTEHLLSELDCMSVPETSDRAAFACLAKQPASKIVLHASRLWSPVLDYVEGLIPVHPASVAGLHVGVPTILGFTRDEAAALVMRQLLSNNEEITLESMKGTLIPDFVSSYLDSSEPVAQTVISQYFSMIPTDNVFSYLTGLIELYSDFLFKAPILAEANLRGGLSQIYMYTFDKPQALGVEWRNIISHGNELDYLWGTSGVANGTSTGTFTPVLAELWSDFIKFGVVRTVTNVEGHWSPYRREDRAILQIADRLRVMTLYEDSRVMFWSQFIPRLLKSFNSPAAVVDSVLLPASKADEVQGQFEIRLQSTTQTSASTKRILHRLSTPETATSEDVDNVQDNTVAASRTFTETANVASASTNATTHLPAPATDMAHIATQNATIITILTEADPSRINIIVMWVMVALALTFCFMFLVTIGVWYVWNKDSKDPHIIFTIPGRARTPKNSSRSRIQAAITAVDQQAMPKIPPRPTVAAIKAADAPPRPAVAPPPRPQDRRAPVVTTGGSNAGTVCRSKK